MLLCTVSVILRRFAARFRCERNRAVFQRQRDFFGIDRVACGRGNFFQVKFFALQFVVGNGKSSAIVSSVAVDQLVRSVPVQAVCCALQCFSRFLTGLFESNAEIGLQRPFFYFA